MSSKCKKAFVLGIRCSLLLTCAGALQPIQVSLAVKYLASSMKIIFLNAFLVDDDNLYIYTHFGNRSLESRYFFDDLVNELLQGELEYSTRSIFYRSPTKFKAFSHYELILVDTLESLRFMYSKLLESGTRDLFYTIVYFSTLHNPDGADIKQAFQLFWKLNALKVGVVMQRSEFDYVIVSYLPFSEVRCWQVQPVIVNQFDLRRRQWTSTNYFPIKVRNFYGCTLTCAIWENMPYLAVERNTKGKVIAFKGIEGHLLEFMLKNLNFKLGVYVMSDKDMEAAVDDNGLIFESLFKNSADFALGGFYLTDDSNGTKYYSQTRTYYFSSIYFVSNILKSISSYEILTYPLHSLTWLSIGLLFVLGCLVLCATGYIKPYRRTFIIGPANRIPYYNMFVVCMGANSSVMLPRRNFARFLLAVWFLATLVLRCAYQSGMYQMMHVSTDHHLPQTIREVLLHSFEVRLKRNNFGLLSNLPEMDNALLLNETDLEALNSLAVSTRQAAIITTYEYFSYFRKKHPPISRQLNLVGERVFTQHLSFYVRRNSFLVNVLNEQIMLAEAFGFLQLWKHEYVDELSEHIGIDLGSGSTAAQSSQESVDANERVLSMAELGSLFKLLVWIELCAIGVFVLELTMNGRRRWSRALE